MESKQGSHLTQQHLCLICLDTFSVPTVTDLHTALASAAIIDIATEETKSPQPFVKTTGQPTKEPTLWEKIEQAEADTPV